MTMERQTYDCAEGCPVESTLQIISGKWKSVILFHLFQGPKRYSDLNRLMPDCSKRMLSLQLKELECDKIISRTVVPSGPITVYYSVTKFGNTLKPIIEAMERWGRFYNTVSRHQTH